MAVARLLELGHEEIGCVSTGNVGTAVASLAAKAGVAAYVFYPSNLERGKARACRALGAAVIQLDGNYDEANRACRELALASGIQFANITLRPVLRRGGEDDGLRGGRAARLARARPLRHPGRRRHALLARPQGPRRAGARRPGGDREDQDQHRPARGLRADRHRRPRRLRRDRAPEPSDRGALAGDRRAGRRPARRRRGDVARAALRRRPTDSEIFEAIDLLGATEGILTEPAGGTTVAATTKLAANGTLGPDDTVVAVISGNGYKTLDEHPDKPWPEMVACEVESMERTLAELRSAGAGLAI